MTSKELFDLLDCNLDKIKDEEHYKNILNQSNNLRDFDMINRVLIEIQKSNAYELRPSNEWLLYGREVNRDATPVYVLVPMYANVYKDTQTDEVFDIRNSDLTLIEASKAVELGILEKTEEIADFKSFSLYDISDTTVISDAERKPVEFSPHMDNFKLLQLLKDITALEVKSGDIDKWDRENNVIYISKKPYNLMCIAISKLIGEVLVFREVHKNIQTTPNNSNISLESKEEIVIREGLARSLCTYLQVEYNGDDLYLISTIDSKELISMFNRMSDLFEGIKTYIRGSTASTTISEIEKFNLRHRCSDILSLLESNRALKLIENKC